MEVAAPEQLAALDAPVQQLAYTPRQPDVLDKTVTFLAKRDGIDKVLKVIRYTSKLLLATALRDSSSELSARLRDFEGSVGTSRKAYRLGKWLADVNAVRKTPLSVRYSYLEILASGGEGIYYFVEQLTWLVKAGLLDKRHARRFALTSAWAELLGYCGNVALNALRISAALEREHALAQELLRRKKEGEQAEHGDSALRLELQQLRARRMLRTLAVVQDLADALLALNDVRDGKGSLANPVLLCMAGLLSAGISFRKNWMAV
ncbi:hypothetical protein WJX81_003471 [Elliptochloris bilobata]|uniref:Peroxisomal membrane protein 11A n=1 Tax=Elliptochloris bilobata TaxID=381761 RepID=A0AAW1QKU6_9CHLO